MADKYVNEVGLGIIKQWANGKFALDSELDTLSSRVDEIVSEGGEPNVIETVKVNNSALPVENKSVNIDLTSYATHEYVNLNGGKIDKIKVNGTEQTITNKEVDITVPTQVSDLTNDSGYQTASDVSSAISQAVASAYKYKGSVANREALPTNAEVGDVYDLQDTGMNVAWTGSAWDNLGSYVDTSVLWTSQTGQTNTLEAMTVAEINAILNAE